MQDEVVNCIQEIKVNSNSNILMGDHLLATDKTEDADTAIISTGRPTGLLLSCKNALMMLALV